MKELGVYLKEERIKNGVNIEEAADDNDLSISQLENIENGNIKAFKDIYKLKEYIKNYAKYLGLDPDKVVEEFNDFLFEHTSKISLEDILEAKKKIEIDEEEKRIKSPYTKEYKEKFNIKPFVYAFIAIIIFLIIVWGLFTLLNKEPEHRKVLYGMEDDLYEFAY